MSLPSASPIVHILLYSPVTAKAAVDMPRQMAPATADIIVFFVTISPYLRHLCLPLLSIFASRRSVIAVTRSAGIELRDGRQALIEISDGCPGLATEWTQSARGRQKARR